ncbi:MAG: LLM class flavin-dependent oxidoreductase [Chloroflexi bacterium]|nr:LLM class flavin-dependent oxidoreductase [Chloroflexota bacterium]
MEFGFLCRVPEEAGKNAHDQFEAAREVALLARESGFRIIAMSHGFAPGPGRVTAPETSFHPLVLLARLAGEVPDTRFLTCIFLVPTYNPVLLAHEVVTLDAVTNGRFMFGMGIGYRPMELSAVAITSKDRGGRMEESLQIMHKLFTEETVTFAGRHFKLDQFVFRAPKPVQAPHPPFLIGAYSDVAVNRAARLADGWLPGAFGELSVLERQAEIYRGMVAKNGRPAGVVGVHRYLWVNEDRERAYAAAMAHEGSPLDGYRNDQLRSSLPEYAARVKAEGMRWIEERAIAGNPDDACRSIERYRARMNPAFMIMRHPSKTLQGIRDTLRLMGREVLPAFKE